MIDLDEVLSNNTWVTEGYFIFLLYTEMCGSRDMGRGWDFRGDQKFRIFR